MTSSKALNLRIEDAARERLDTLSARKPYSIVSRHKLALIALDLGVAALEKNPQLLLMASPGAPTEFVIAPARPARATFTAADGQLSILQRVDNDMVPSVAEGVAERLRALAGEEDVAGVPRARRRWTQSAIGRACGVAQSTVGRLLRGEEVTPENVTRIARLIPK